ncbi:MAG: UvrD-helicase domain-containing protein [Planctomycetota bacterium]|nr:UvrD-helicase domain-containing protein [Planctomycetota bacterium]
MPSDATLTPPQRRAAIERIRENLVLRSGAGCGKTFVLARRFVELLQAAEADSQPLRRLVALTFTDKAALEMAQRVRTMLRDLAAEASPERRKLLLAWLEELPEARISTIHSFCASLLRSHAVEAGLDPVFAVCSETQLTDRLLTESADETLLAAVEAEDAPATALLGSFSFDGVVDLLSQLVRRRGTCEFGEYADPAGTLERWRVQIEREADAAWARLAGDDVFRGSLEHVRGAVCRDESDKLAAARDRTVTIVEGLLNDPRTRIPAAIDELPMPGNTGRQAVWDVEVKGLRGCLRTIVEMMRDMRLYTDSLGPADRAAADALAALTGLALKAQQRYAQAKRQRGLLDFDDLIVHAQRLIRTRPDVARAAAESIDQLLVDECQDTDAVQLSLLRPLLGAQEGAPPPEGKLFVVGDAKQSIYRFRGAQVEVFDDLCTQLGPEKQEHLNTSFRTHEAGVAFVNHLFAPLMGEAFEPIVAHRKTNPPSPSVEIILARDPEGSPIDSAEGATLAQADAVADRIAGMLAAGEKTVWDAAAKDWRAGRPGDVAVLFARMTQSLPYERALQARGVPYYVVGGVGFFRQQEVYDLVNALRVIDNPMADVEFFGVLRSSLFGLDDNALMSIARASRRPYLPALRETPAADPADLPEYQRRALRHACELLSALHARKDAVGIDSLLEDLLAGTGYEACMLAGPQGRRIVGNIRLLVDRARAAAAQGTALADFLGEIDELIVAETRQEQAAVAGEEDDVVRVMTIHRAKGLEFPVVVLADLNVAGRAKVGALQARHGWPLVLKCAAPDEETDDEADDSLAYRICRQLEVKDSQREDLRKYYVAATRHEDRLILVGADWRTQDGEFHKGSFLAQIDGVLGIREHLGAGDCGLPYGGRFQAGVTSVAPVRAARAAGAEKPGAKLLAGAADGEALAAGMLGGAGGKAAGLPLLGPLPEGACSVEVAVTALGEFAYCPARYRWQYELRAPVDLVELQRGEERNTAKPQAVGNDGGMESQAVGGNRGAESQGDEGRTTLDAATMGTLYHACMERLDFDRPQAAGALLRQAVEELGLSDPGPGAEGKLATMIEAMKGTELWGELRAAAPVVRELDFVLTLGHLTLRGQIDLLYRGRDGRWHIVDYKSDRVGTEGVAAHAGRYELQMTAYAQAASRWLGAQADVADATLYFLRAAAGHRFDLGLGARARGSEEIAALAARLAEARRRGRFDPADGDHCRTCAYRGLCDPERSCGDGGRADT